MVMAAANSMSSDPLEPLRASDARLDAAAVERRSLCPGRARATSLEAIGRQLFVGVDGEVAHDVAAALAGFADAVLAAFPGNIFWDFDYVATRLLEARQQGRGQLSEMTERLVALQQSFGCRSAIQFRYVHDFLYGFDWARWVQKAPETRQRVGPFDVEFLRYLDRRGGELLELIADNDAKYPKLPPGEVRNPFDFPRDPQDEARLHEDLARRGLIPVEAWRFDATPRFSEPFSDLRRERAQALI